MLIIGIVLATIIAFIPFTLSFFKIGSKFGRPVGGMASSGGSSKYPVYIEDEVMNQKAHGTCEKPVMRDIQWNCDYETADRISCFNRHYAEHSGYWETTKFLEEVRFRERNIFFFLFLIK